jgi:DNA-binding NarL/FixJ family response regulator/class 3 adenylate cyclase
VSNLPHGTVTLVFTDVEGSTRLVHEFGDDFERILDDHRRLFRQAVDAAGGREVDCRGDEFFVVFTEANGAVEAALAGQRAFAAHRWPEGADLRVRMGMHTGQPSVRPEGYFGLDVHRAARICQAGHGGQILLSETTRQALDGHHLLEDLGIHQLRGLPEPERIFQLNAPDLPGRFPSLNYSRKGMRGMRVVLAEDSVLLREGVARLLEDAGFDVVAQGGTAEDLLRHVSMHKPDIAIVDIRMPPTQTDEGLRAAQEIRERFPETGVLVLSQYVEPGYAMELLGENAEGVGYLLKDRVSDVEEFAGAVRRVGEGGSALDPAVVSQLVGRRRRDDPLEELTPREREVLAVMAEGRSNAGIARRLWITEGTVERHVHSIMMKLTLPESDDDHRRVLAAIRFLDAHQTGLSHS